jgi:hypothetical protein
VVFAPIQEYTHRIGTVTWRRLLLALAALGMVLAVTSWIVEGVTPSWIVFPILLVIGLVRARRGGSAGTVWIGVSALIFLLVHLPFDKAALSDNCVNPTGSDKTCHPIDWIASLGVYPVLLIVASVFAFREAGGVVRVPRLRR